MPLQIKDGDIPQLEVDYQRGAEDIYKSVEIKIEGQIGKLHSSMYPLILSFFSCVVTEYGFSTNALKNLKTFALPGANGKQGKSDICYIY